MNANQLKAKTGGGSFATCPGRLAATKKRKTPKRTWGIVTINPFDL